MRSTSRQPLPRRPASQPLRERAEEPLARPAQLTRLLPQHGGEVGPVTDRTERVADQLLHAEAGYLKPEVVGGHVLQRVGLVEDDRVVVGQDLDPGARGPHREVGEEEVVVDEEQLGRRRAGAGAGDEALVPELALATKARVAGGGEIAPGGELVGQVDLAPVAGLGRTQPALDARPEGRLVADRKGRGACEGLAPLQAVVVGAPLEVGGVDLEPGLLSQDRQVLPPDLLLEVLGRGRDDDPPAGEDRGHQVGERLPGAGPGLGDEVAVPLECPLHRAGHRQLVLTVLVAGERARQPSASPQDLLDV